MADEQKDSGAAGMVATPTGLQPVSTVARSPEEAKRALTAQEKRVAREEKHPKAGGKLTEKQLEGLGRADLAAVAESRGLDAGRRPAEKLREAILADVRGKK